MFTITHIDLGKVKVGQPIKIEFPFDEETNYINGLSTPCGCTTGKINYSNKTVDLVYTPQVIPIHLQNHSFPDGFTVEKSVIIRYISNEDGTQKEVTLKFTATI